MTVTNAILADNSSIGVAGATGLTPGHYCCRGHVPNSTELAMANGCFQTQGQGMASYAQVEVGPQATLAGIQEHSQGSPAQQGSLVRVAVDEKASLTVQTVRKHHSSHQELQHDVQIQDYDHENFDRPSVFSGQVIMASLPEFIDDDMLNMAASQIAHLARTTTSLIMVDKRVLGKVMSLLQDHRGRFRVMEQRGLFVLFVVFVATGLVVAAGRS